MESAVLNHLKSAVLMLSLVVLSSTFAMAQSKDVVRGQITLKGTVQAIDRVARTITILGAKGNVVTVDVPTSIARFNELKVGDAVSLSYFDQVSVRPKPADEAAVDKTEPPVTTATAGSLPGATVVSQRTTTVTITGWDPATRVVTFTGPAGAAYSRRLQDKIDPSVLAALKVGDRVDVTRTEAAQLAVESRSAVTVEATDGFRNRVTVSTLWGWENNFSGNMIKGAAGQTTTGLPIALNDTSFDDVYGRMTGFKIGVGYRTTPRSEAVFNFTIARNSAERLTIGTVGTTPVDVDFEDYNNFGFEVGQRFFFTRVRFTPFVGYLVGLNRYDDIRGTFVNVAPELTPGLAAQDGKFFEKAWAFNLGPTAVMLVGLGPIELMGEAQLRYMGGLSDVDWLIEEGLRDINKDSERWSFPVQLGIRIRF